MLVGPEGDFSIDEVRLALENGYECFAWHQSPPYGNSRIGGCQHVPSGKSFIIFTSVMKRLYKSLMFMCLAVVLGLLSSCSGTDYLNAIPKKSTALISVDMQQMASGKSDEDKAGNAQVSAAR